MYFYIPPQDMIQSRIMLQNLLNSLFKFFFSILAIGLAIAIFLIGIVALWYFILIGMGIWIIRSFYLSFKTRKSAPVEAGGVEVILHEDLKTRPKQSRPGRVIEHE